MKKAAHISILAYLNNSTNKRINNLNFISKKFTNHLKKNQTNKTNEKLIEQLFKTYNVEYNIKNDINQISNTDNTKVSSLSTKTSTKILENQKEQRLRPNKIRDSNRQKSSKIKEQERSIIKNDKKFLKKFNKLVLDSNNSKINIKKNKKLCSFKAKNSSQDAVGNPKLDSTSQSFSSRSNSESSLKNSINIKVSLEATFATKKAL